MVFIFALCQMIFLFTGCEKQEPELNSEIGHFELKVTYIINTRTGQFPDEGSKMYLFSDQAKCPDFYEALQGYARIDGKTVFRRYWARADENGEIFMYNIKADTYYMVVVSSFHERYTEKIIEVPLGDTLILHKNFSNSARFWHDLEPWDYVKPE
jgi:hypothetical protein